MFLDTAYAIALAAPADQLRGRAVALSAELRSGSTRLVTTQAVLLEIGNALAKRRHRAAAVAMLAALGDDPTVEVVPMSPELYATAFGLYRGRADKEWGLIDCVSFVVMEARGIAEALTSDAHFEQAGFRALLRDD